MVEKRTFNLPLPYSGGLAAVADVESGSAN